MQGADDQLCQRTCQIGGYLTRQEFPDNSYKLSQQMFPVGHKHHGAHLFLMDDGSAPPWDALGGYCPGSGCTWEARCMLEKTNLCMKNKNYDNSKCEDCSSAECTNTHCLTYICLAKKSVKCLAIIPQGNMHHKWEDPNTMILALTMARTVAGDM